MSWIEVLMPAFVSFYFWLFLVVLGTSWHVFFVAAYWVPHSERNLSIDLCTKCDLCDKMSHVNPMIRPRQTKHVPRQKKEETGEYDGILTT